MNSHVKTLLKPRKSAFRSTILPNSGGSPTQLWTWACINKRTKHLLLTLKVHFNHSCTQKIIYKQPQQLPPQCTHTCDHEVPGTAGLKAHKGHPSCLHPPPLCWPLLGCKHLHLLPESAQKEQHLCKTAGDLHHSVIQSILTYCTTVWFTHCSQDEWKRSTQCRSSSAAPTPRLQTSIHPTTAAELMQSHKTPPILHPTSTCLICCPLGDSTGPSKPRLADSRTVSFHEPSLYWTHVHPSQTHKLTHQYCSHSYNTHVRPLSDLYNPCTFV